MKITRHDIGRWCTVKYSDVGRVDALITGVNSEHKYVDVFIPITSEDNDADFSQVVELRNHVEPE
jgi:hypothetical protein